MTPEELQAAERFLSQRPEFAWLISSGKQWFNITDVANGSGVSRNTVRDWCQSAKLPGAVYYGPEIGWRIPRSGLIEYFSRTMRGPGDQQAG
jgi:Helix-turn-helix domain